MMGKEFTNLTEEDLCDLMCGGLEEEPCEDMISRDSVFDELDKLQDGLHRDAVVHVDCIADIIANLPSVTPKKKIGHWILCNPLQKDDGGAYVCSVCNAGDWGKDGTEKYCPNCGARMEV